MKMNKTYSDYVFTVLSALKISVNVNFFNSQDNGEDSNNNPSTKNLGQIMHFQTIHLNSNFVKY